jgi:hypothetical protein
MINELQLIIYQQTVNQLPFKLISAWTYIFADREEKSVYTSVQSPSFGCQTAQNASCQSNRDSATTAWSIQNQHTSCKVLALLDKCKESE